MKGWSDHALIVETVTDHRVPFSTKMAGSLAEAVLLECNGWQDRSAETQK